MLNITRSLVLGALVVILGGCVSYKETIENQLQGKAPEEKRAVLAAECGNQIVLGLKTKFPSDLRHVNAMKQICEEMTGNSVDVTLTEPDQSK